MRRRAGREPYLDNVKFVAITLVVFGHAVWSLSGDRPGRAAYVFVYAFHMPLFVLLSGYLSRNFWRRGTQRGLRLFETLLVPYLVFEVAYAVFRKLLGQPFTLSVTEPAWLNWYLLALLLWRLSTPVFQRLRAPVTASVLICLAAGAVSLPAEFSVDRFFGLLPFFVAGLFVRPRHLAFLHRRAVRAAAACVLAAAAAAAVLLAPLVKRRWVYFRYEYDTLGLDVLTGTGMRLATLVIGAVLALAVLALIPRRRTWFSSLGSRTLYVYLLHGFVVLAARELGWLDLPWMRGPEGVAVIAVSSLAVAVTLSSPPVRSAARWIVEPPARALFR
ncbi:acyltransferase [Bailinhaonella thermotolerans]|uniref:Acyltransferase n=1 Tax=Bailinhaonella thermotolerans TaxID=1070861 RepID=A0A3A4AXK9_9ACTN|nr:acyltransferase [Bailinhaonella thermotolerans]